MKNGYIKLFELLAKEEPNSIIPIEKFSDLGFFLTDFERMHKEGFVFLERINEIKDKKTNVHIIKHYVKLAPKGFASLEEFNRNERQDQINHKTLKATMIIALATALGIFVNFIIFLLNIEQNQFKGVLIAVLVVVIAGLTGLLFVEVYNLTFPRKERTK